MVYQVQADDSSLMDAHFDLAGNNIIFHSRGGNKGKNARNADYSRALRLLLERLAKAGTPVQCAWVDSRPVQAIPLDKRTILEPGESQGPAEELVSLMASRMQAIGRRPNSKSSRGNSTKRICLQLSADVVGSGLLKVLKAVPSDKDFSSEERLPASDLKKVTAEHLWMAVKRLEGGFKNHRFAESTDFDVVLESGTRIPPKAVFGLAATEALGFDVKPKHFTGGLNSPCFRALERAGYQIVLKEGKDMPSRSTPEGADREWVEGTPRIRKHLCRERSAGLSEAKKAEFRRTHQGKLFCQKCQEDPVEKYGSDDAEACIEVHHSKVLVSKMEDDHVTKLADLECLCANCHRIEHRRLRLAT